VRTKSCNPVWTCSPTSSAPSSRSDSPTPASLSTNRRLVEEGTRLADASEGVSDDTWDQVRKHYDDDQLAALVSLVALINAANRMAVILNQQGGSYEVGMFASFSS
jgi:hypothetical protein